MLAGPRTPRGLRLRVTMKRLSLLEEALTARACTCAAEPPPRVKNLGRRRRRQTDATGRVKSV
jgi:hypothetical protein